MKRLLIFLSVGANLLAMEQYAEKPVRQWPTVTVKTADGWQGHFEPAMLERLQSDFLSRLVFGGVQFAELASGQPVVDLPADFFNRELVQLIIQFASADDEERLNFLATMPLDRLRAVTVAFDFLMCEHLHGMALSVCIRRMLYEVPIEQLPEYQAEIDRLLSRCAPQFTQTLAAEFRGVVRGVQFSECNACQLSHDGTRVITFGYDGRLHVFDAATGNESAVSAPVCLPDAKNTKGCFAKFECSSDGQFVAVGFKWFVRVVDTGKKEGYCHQTEYDPVCAHCTVIFNVATVQSITAQPLEGEFISFNPNGSKCALGHKTSDYAERGTVTIHECADGRELDSFDCHAGRACSCWVKWRPNSSQWCVFVNPPGGERRLEIHGDRFCHKLLENCDGCWDWCFSTDGYTLACNQRLPDNRERIMLLDLRTMQTKFFDRHFIVALSPDGSRLIAHPRDNEAGYLWENGEVTQKHVIINVQTGAKIADVVPSSELFLTFTEDGTRVFIQASDKTSPIRFVSHSYSSRIQIFDLADGQRVADFRGVHNLGSINKKNGLGALLEKGADGSVSLKFFDSHTGQMLAASHPHTYRWGDLSYMAYSTNGVVCRLSDKFFDAAGNLIGTIQEGDGWCKVMSDDGSCALFQNYVENSSLKVKPTIYHVFNVPANPTVEQLLAVAHARRCVQTSLPPEPK